MKVFINFSRFFSDPNQNLVFPINFFKTSEEMFKKITIRSFEVSISIVDYDINVK